MNVEGLIGLEKPLRFWQDQYQDLLYGSLRLVSCNIFEDNEEIFKLVPSGSLDI